MTTDAYLILAILTVTFVFLIKTKIPPPAVFMGALTVAITFGLAPLEELLKGFSNQGMLTVGVLFIVAAGTYSTGAITILMDKFIGRPQKIATAQLKILPPIAVGSAFLNNTPLVAMLIPVIRDLCRASGLSAKQLYIPLSFASILGGTCTIIGTSTNLVIAGLIADTLAGGHGYSQMRNVKMFDPAVVGLPAAVIGIAVIILVGRFLLPKDAKAQTLETIIRRRYTAEFTVREKSRISGKTLTEAGLAESPHLRVITVVRQGEKIDISSPDFRLAAHDLITFSTEVDTLMELWRTNSLIPHLNIAPMKTKRHQHNLIRAVVSGRSMAVGRKIKHLPRTKSPYPFKIVAVSRDGKAVDGPLSDLRIKAGDNLVLEADETFVYQTYVEKDFYLTRTIEGFNIQRTDRAVEAGLITLAMITTVAVGWMSMLNAGLLAAGAMLLTGCLTFRTAARSIDWGTLAVIACAIGLESAVTRSGLADQVAGLLTRIAGDSPYVALTAIFLGCSVMTNIITNNAAAAFMFPIALSTASQLGVNFMPFAITIMIAASGAFITPTGYQTNLMVWGPGGYAFTDYVKIGLLITAIVAVLTLILTPLFYPF